ncbi:PqqD family protein [Sphingomonas koreensis]|nr:PqqD family protein [Sphingomonas koreensis]
MLQTTQPSTAALLVAHDDVVACDLGGSTALLDLRSSSYFTLNEVGAAVWGQMKQPMSIDAICQVVNECYDVEPARCRADVTVLIERFLEAGLVRAV